MTTVLLKGNSEDEKMSPPILRKEIQPFHQKWKLASKPLFLVHEMMQDASSFDLGTRQSANFVKARLF